VPNKIHSKDEAVPKEVADQLADMLYWPHSHITVYVICLTICVPIFWWRSSDGWIFALAAAGVALNVGRIVLLSCFEKRHRHRERSKTYWALILGLGCCFALIQAFLVARAFVLGDTVIITLAVMSASTYVIGLIVRASAVPRLAVPHLLFLFIPLAVAAACAPDKGYLAVATFLAVCCVICVELSLSLYQRTKAQLMAEHQLSVLARTDYLTGLANRAGLESHSNGLLGGCNPNRQKCAFALIDLDGFKSVNDAHGHGVGDHLLKEVAIRIKAALNDAHFAARLGGDEFAVMFDHGLKLDEAVALSNQIVARLEQPFQIADVRLTISCSVGITRSAGSRDNLTLVVERADKALYRAKNAGRNQTQVLTAPELEAA
jgi:diguanylate cyclase (GGDEF)-like protein